jgi:Na+/H+-dicarboxylate symporter
MAKAKKVLGLLPRSVATTLILGLVATFLLAWAWSYVMSQSFSEDAWVVILEYIALAVLIGLIVGLIANNEKPVTLWIAAGLTVVGVIMIQALMAYAPYGFDAAVLASFGEEAFGLSVSVGAVLLGIIAAACAASASRTKDVLAM